MLKYLGLFWKKVKHRDHFKGIKFFSNHRMLSCFIFFSEIISQNRKLQLSAVLIVISGVTYGFPSLSPPGQNPKSKIEFSNSPLSIYFLIYVYIVLAE